MAQLMGLVNEHHSIHDSSSSSSFDEFSLDNVPMGSATDLLAIQETFGG